MIRNNDTFLNKYDLNKNNRRNDSNFHIIKKNRKNSFIEYFSTKFLLFIFRLFCYSIYTLFIKKDISNIVEYRNHEK